MFICMQKIHFLTHFFLITLWQRNSKLVILGNLGMPGYTHLKMILSIWINFWWLTAGKKSTSFFTFSLWYCKIFISVLWALLTMHTQSDAINLEKNFKFIWRKNINFIPLVFLKILQRHASLFWVIWPCLITHIQNYSINL